MKENDKIVQIYSGYLAQANHNAILKDARIEELEQEVLELRQKQEDKEEIVDKEENQDPIEVGIALLKGEDDE